VGRGEAKSIPNHCNCGRCGKPVRQDGNFLRAHLWGAVLFHWSCFVGQMRDSDFIRAHFTRGAVLLHWRCFLAQMRESNMADHNNAARPAVEGRP
jgi:hypothetical protein